MKNVRSISAVPSDRITKPDAKESRSLIQERLFCCLDLAIGIWKAAFGRFWAATFPSQKNLQKACINESGLAPTSSRGDSIKIDRMSTLEPIAH